MTGCEPGRRIQDFLDGELPPEASRAFREHLGRCPACAAELALYRRAFASLDRVPLADPAPSLTRRILERVLPSRVRRRRVVAAGWTYAALMAVGFAAMVAWLADPASRTWLEALWGEASRRLVHTVVFGLEMAGFLVLSLVDGWGALATIGARAAPLLRALGSAAANPTLQTVFALAAASFAALLWWMRPRRPHGNGEVRPVGVLGF